MKAQETKSEVVESKCLWCETAFVPVTKGGHTKVFCSGTCRAKHSQAQQPRVSSDDYQLLQKLKAKPEVLALL